MPALNQMIYEKHRHRPLGEVTADFQRSHIETLALIQSLSNEDLFTAGRFTWTKTNTLGAYFVSNTSSHYLWARKEIRKGLKARLA
ncbi:MAG: ClbS/DfsB family four-helix bundle protein [Caldilineaceae bacterium]